MRVIIAPTDFSASSLNAVNYATDMASAIHASLALLHVCELPLSYTELPIPGDVVTEMIAEAEKRIEKLRADINAKTGGKIRVYAEIKVGSVVNQLEDYCAPLKPYAVVMSTQGAGAAERFFFGSNTIAVMKRLVWPLIVVPAGAKFTSIKKIGLACDLKKVVETEPVEEVKTLVKEFNATLDVIHVNTDEDINYGSEIIEESGALQEMLDELHPSYHFLNQVEIEDGLSAFAIAHKLDLLIVVPKKHNIIGRLFHKSHSKQLITHAHVPVMAVHE
jgi:nucleotide-binding universal stress UspA family protein